MALYSKLDVVNKGLSLLGQLPVNDLLTQHPGVPAVLAALDTANRKAQTKRYWFNYERATLVPTVDKRILVPNDVASIDAVDKRLRVAQRGRYLFNTAVGNYDFEAPVDVLLHRVLPFEDLPAVAQAYVSALALSEMQSGLDGDGVRFRQLADEKAEAFADLTAENTRNSQTNLLHRRGVQVALHRVNQDSSDPFRR